MVERPVQDSILLHTGNSNPNDPLEKTYLINAQQARHSRSRLSLVTVWWAETISLLMAIGAFLAIVTILAVYDNQEQPAWKYSLNLNTLVAILSTLLRASLVVIVEEGKCWRSYLLPDANNEQSSANLNGCGIVDHTLFISLLASTRQLVAHGALYY
jgi:hypothetical protein